MKKAENEAGDGQKPSSASSKNIKQGVLARLMELVAEAEARDDFMGVRILLRNAELLLISGTPLVEIAQAYTRVVVRGARKSRKVLFTKRKITGSVLELLAHVSTMSDRLCFYLKSHEQGKSRPIEEIISAGNEIERFARTIEKSQYKSSSSIQSLFDQLNRIIAATDELKLLAEPAQGSREELLAQSALAVKAARACLSRLCPSRWSDWDRCLLFARVAMNLLQAEAWHHPRASAAYEAMRNITFMQLATVVEAIKNSRHDKARDYLKSATQGIASLHALLRGTF